MSERAQPSRTHEADCPAAGAGGDQTRPIPEADRPRGRSELGRDREASGSEVPGSIGRPISEAIRRRAIHLTHSQSDALARLMGTRRLVELYSLRNGTVVATFRGGGYKCWRAYLTTEGRVLEDDEASRLDPELEEEGAYTILRDDDHLYLGTILPKSGGGQRSGGGECGKSQSGRRRSSSSKET